MSQLCKPEYKHLKLSSLTTNSSYYVNNLSHQQPSVPAVRYLPNLNDKYNHTQTQQLAQPQQQHQHQNQQTNHMQQSHQTQQTQMQQRSLNKQRVKSMKKEKDEKLADVPMWPVVVSCIGYVFICFFGWLRELLRKAQIEKKQGSYDSNPKVIILSYLIILLLEKE